MKMTELRSKDEGALQKLLKDVSAELKSLRVKARGSDLKGVRSIRVARQAVARIKTQLVTLRRSVR